MTQITYFHQADKLNHHLKEVLDLYDSKQIFLLCDSHSKECCVPILEAATAAHIMVVPAGDEHKNIEELSRIWEVLSQQGATRKALLINVGGGMITDMGGFAAACFKRGFDFINIPTTILACVDASLGGKTGINFNGLKNEIGAFYPAKEVLIYTPFFKTLDRENLYSGYAEMLKHGLLSSEAHWKEVVNMNPEDTERADFGEIIVHSMEVKEKVVRQDPKEQGLRKALNLGHTIGHAFESYSYQRNQPILHGYAVAYGLICELYISYKLLNFPKDILQSCVYRIKELYGYFPIECKEYPALLEKMHHDKKNSDSQIQFALLSNIGEIHINQTATESLIEESLDFYRDCLE